MGASGFRGLASWFRGTGSGDGDGLSAGSEGDWFAVDRDGHVALFEGGRSGAIPRWAAQGRERFGALLPSLARAAVVTDPLFELEGRLLPGLEASADDLHAPLESPAERPVVLFLTSVDPIAADIAAGRATPVRGTLGSAAAFERLPPETAQRVHAAGACLGCFFEREEDQIEPAQLGLFSYRHLTDGWVAGPYGRRAIPATAMRVHQLPAGIREELIAQRFETCFQDEVHLQPVDHARCNSAVSAYLCLDGRTVRPIPGRESEYRQFFLPRHRRDPRFLIERPPE